MSARKHELLDGLIAYLLRHGPTDLSLRPMAAELGTSARLLIFHFGSKEKLLADTLREMQARLQRSFARLLARAPERDDVPLLRVVWDWALAKENFRYLRLQYQLHVLATQDRVTFAEALEGNTLKWLELIRAALPPSKRDPALATLYGAVFDGLFIDVVSTGNRRRTTRALEQFIALARGQVGTAAHARRRARYSRREHSPR